MNKQTLMQKFERSSPTGWLTVDNLVLFQSKWGEWEWSLWGIENLGEKKQEQFDDTYSMGGFNTGGFKTRKEAVKYAHITLNDFGISFVPKFKTFRGNSYVAKHKGWNLCAEKIPDYPWEGNIRNGWHLAKNRFNGDFEEYVLCADTLEWKTTLQDQTDYALFKTFEQSIEAYLKTEVQSFKET